MTDWPVPTPGPRDVLVKILSAAINLADWKVQKWALIKDYPWVGGCDAAGVVEEVGSEVTNVIKGDRVFFQTSISKANAGFLEHSLAPAGNVAKIPDNISFDEAASIPLALATAITGLWSHHPEAQSVNFPAPWEEGGTTKFSGQPALVVGGSSSIGQYAIQMAKLQGFSPIVTTSSLKHADYLKPESIGATHILDRSLPSDAILAELPKITGGKLLVYAYDAIAEDTTQNLAYDARGPGGSLVVTFATTILQLKIDRDSAAGVSPEKKVVSAMGSFALQANKALGEEVCKRLTEWLRTGLLVPNRVEVLPGGLAGVLEECARMEANKVSGVKLVVHPQETA
ncbi:GroES-like protein [Daedaleopsis nitida]|nr:GroES-like protein [Daedaleopsis nitida]